MLVPKGLNAFLLKKKVEADMEKEGVKEWEILENSDFCKGKSRAYTILTPEKTFRMELSEISESPVEKESEPDGFLDILESDPDEDEDEDVTCVEEKKEFDAEEWFERKETRENLKLLKPKDPRPFLIPQSLLPDSEFWNEIIKHCYYFGFKSMTLAENGIVAEF